MIVSGGQPRSVSSPATTFLAPSSSPDRKAAGGDFGATIAVAGPTVFRVLTTIVAGSARCNSSARLPPG